MDTVSTEQHFPIRELSARTQVNTVTIRAWERRYGLLKPRRTEKGHRLYSENDVQRVEKILELVARGVPLSKVKQLIDTDNSSQDWESPELNNNWPELVDDLVASARRYSSTRIEALLSEVLIQYPTSVCLERLLKPAFEMLERDDDHQAAWLFTENEILRYAFARLSAKKSTKDASSIYLTRGEKTPLWQMAMVALGLADSNCRVHLISQNIHELAWLAMAQKNPEDIYVLYRDGIWRDDVGIAVKQALDQTDNLIVCGTAPAVFGLNKENQIFPDIEQYLESQITQTKTK